MASLAPTITPEKVAQVGGLLQDKLYEGPPEFRQAYARLLLDEVLVSDEEIRTAARNPFWRDARRNASPNPCQKFSFVQGWRARQDSNPCPLPSEEANAAASDGTAACGWRFLVFVHRAYRVVAR